VNGLVQTVLNFPQPFDETPRYLQIQARLSGTGNSYINLTPRQPLTLAPVAAYALNVSPSVAKRDAANDFSQNNVFQANVGITDLQQMTPSFPLHLDRGQAIAHLHSRNSINGSVLQLSSNTDPFFGTRFTGAINFVGPSGLEAQIANDDFNRELLFKVGANQRMKIDTTGRTTFLASALAQPYRLSFTYPGGFPRDEAAIIYSGAGNRGGLQIFGFGEPRLTITDLGFVGIRTDTAPQFPLDLQGRLQIRGNEGASESSPGIWFASPTAAPVLRSFVGQRTNTQVGIYADGWHLLVGNDGRVALGDFVPTYKLQLPNIGSNEGRAIASRWDVYSSRSYKENIRTIDGAMAKLTQLRGVFYSWKEEYGGTKDLGFIAQEVYPILPEVVTLDENGEPRSIDYSRITALAVEAIKEQQSTVDRLAKENEDLKARLERLERLLGEK
jgi:hypothetical protein